MSTTRKRSSVWLYFTESPKNKKATCDLCKKVLSINGGNVANLGRHLLKKHPTVNTRTTEQPSCTYADPRSDAIVSGKKKIIDDIDDASSPIKKRSLRSSNKDQYNRSSNKDQCNSSYIPPSTPRDIGHTLIFIANLNIGVADSDILDLFSEFGEIVSHAVHYDRCGRSLGMAHVVFEKYFDALKAIAKYDGVILDDEPMNITIGLRNNNASDPLRRSAKERLRGRISQSHLTGSSNKPNEVNNLDTDVRTNFKIRIINPDGINKTYLSNGSEDNPITKEFEVADNENDSESNVIISYGDDTEITSNIEL